MLCFFKTTLTVPKIKDLVNSPTTKYQHIFDTIANTNLNSRQQLQTDENSYSEIDLLPSDSMTNTNTNTNAMKNELKNFLKTKLNNGSDSIGSYTNY